MLQVGLDAMRKLLLMHLPGRELNLLQLYICTKEPVADTSADAGFSEPVMQLNLKLVLSIWLAEKDVKLSKLLWHMFSSVTSATKPRAVAKLTWL